MAVRDFVFGLICTGAAFTGLVLEVVLDSGCPVCAIAVPVISTTVAIWIKLIFIVAPPLALPHYFCATVVAGAPATGEPRTLLKKVLAVQATVTLSVGA